LDAIGTSSLDELEPVVLGEDADLDQPLELSQGPPQAGDTVCDLGGGAHLRTGSKLAGDLVHDDIPSSGDC
jgi:hypothetical protein